MRITLVEDNVSLSKGIAYSLEDAGHSVDVFHNGTDAAAQLQHDQSDLLILDINLPGIDGLSLLKSLRAAGDGRPVILLTARADTSDRVTGLDAGADDYLIKPFEMAELNARVRALLRRRSAPERHVQEIGGLTLDSAARQFFGPEGEIELPRREFAMLECLTMAQGRLVSKAVILDHVYGTGADVEETVVEVYVSRLRRRLKPYGIRIKAQRGLGYQLLTEPEE